MIPLVKSGDPLKLKARDWNEVARVVNKSSALPGAREGAGGPADVVVKNTTGAELPRFSFVKANGVVITPNQAGLGSFCEGPIFNAAIPSAGEDCPLLYLGFPISSNDFGFAKCTGVCVVKFSSANTSHPYAVPDGNGGLKTAEKGSVSVLYCPSNGSNVWGAVLLLAGSKSDDRTVDMFKIKANYSTSKIDVSSGRVINGPNNISCSNASFDFPASGSSYYIILTVTYASSSYSASLSTGASAVYPVSISATYTLTLGMVTNDSGNIVITDYRHPGPVYVEGRWS